MVYIISLAIVYAIAHWPVWLQFIFSVIFTVAISLFNSNCNEKHHQKKVWRKLVKRLSKDRTNKKSAKQNGQRKNCHSFFDYPYWHLRILKPSTHTLGVVHIG